MENETNLIDKIYCLILACEYISLYLTCFVCFDVKIILGAIGMKMFLTEFSKVILRPLITNRDKKETSITNC